MAQLSVGLTVEMPERPEILRYVDQFLVTGYLYNDGGLGDQPYIFMQEFVIAYDRLKLYDKIQRINAQAQNQQQR